MVNKVEYISLRKSESWPCSSA